MRFDELGLAPEILRAITEEGYTNPTPIQAQAIPIVLSGKDLMGGAQTGTGKTAAFTLPLLQRILPFASPSPSPARHPVRILMLAPTRELAIQVHESVKTYSKYVPIRSLCAYGGVDIKPQIEEIRAGIEVLVATPGRLLDLVEQKCLNFGSVQALVLDEADRMLDMGFIPDVTRIISLLPKQRQSLLFSATFSDEIKKLADRMLQSPVLIEVARRNTVSETITHRVHPVAADAKRALLQNQEPVGKPVENDAAQTAIDEEIPRYPPFMKGLPATDPHKLIETQRELIGQIREAGLASPDIFEQYYLESLRRFASYAHLLPASQTHHHRGAGGLLRHAAEVALWSLQSGDRVLLPGEQAPRRRRELEPRWHLAVFLAALCHDVGKPVTDLVVTSRDGAKVWNPFVEDLYSWASRHGVDRYFLHWRENRAKKHTAISSLIAERIISPKGLAWIAEGDTELVLWMMETINGHPSAENLIHDLVIRSDQVSVERDLRNLGVAFTGYEIGLPVERFLVDIMRRLVRDGTWGINEPGSRLWLIDGHLYLIWPAAGEEMAAIINQEKIPGLPRTPNSILDMLVDRKLANVREDRTDGNGYWVIAPDVLAEKIPNIRLTAIRLRDTALVIDPAPSSVPGKILDQKEIPKEMPSISTPKLPVDAEPAVSPALIRAPVQSEKVNAKPPEEVVDRLDGPVGEALKALAEDIQTGEKSSETLTHIDSSGVLCLKWPEALNGYGLENKSILDELSRRNWLVLDPLSPFRKVVEIEIDGGKTWKVVRLQPVVKQLMAIGKTPPEPSTVSTPSADPVQLPKPVQGEIEGIGEDTRLALIQSIVTTLREGVREGILTADADGAFVWIQSRKAEPFLVERLLVNRMSIMRLGSVVPDVFMCQTRKKAHSYRIPAMPSVG